LLGAGPVDLDELARLTDAPAHAVAAAVLELELAGRAERRPGGLVARAADAF
jgi:DNA processing protein